MDKIAFCIPTTSNKREWKTFEDTYLNNILLPSIKDLDITIYVGYGTEDNFFMDTENRKLEYNNIKLVWKAFHKHQGNPCAIWNGLAGVAFDDGFDYVFVLGDDIKLSHNPNWIETFINRLKDNDNIGYSAGWSNNDQIPTQFLLHKTHFNIFGWIYPPQIKNWQCDDFLYHLYGKYGNWLKDIHHLNLGGEPRYVPDNCVKLRELLVKRHRKQLFQYLNKNKYMD
tara:strand:- start:28 stop:705 length:678 start_codon:yes stop_codon:yes gene_type:complete